MSNGMIFLDKGGTPIEQQLALKRLTVFGHVEEKNSILLPIACGSISTAILWVLSRRHVLPVLALMNSATMLMARESSGIALPPKQRSRYRQGLEGREREQVAEEAAETLVKERLGSTVAAARAQQGDDVSTTSSLESNSQKPSSSSSPHAALDPSRPPVEAKRKQLQANDADRLLFAAGTSAACAAWAGQFGFHVVRVFTATGENAALWRRSSTAQVLLAGATAVGFAYKALFEARIAWSHRYD